MTNQQFLDLIGTVGESYVLAADQPRKRKPLRFIRIGLIAACLCAALVGTAFATGVAQEVWQFLYKPDDPITYSGDISPALQELAEELRQQALSAPVTDPEPSGYTVDTGSRQLLRYLDNWAQCREYLPLMDNEWLDGDSFRPTKCYVGADSDLYGELSSTQVGAQGELDGHPFHIYATMFIEREGSSHLSLGVITNGDPDEMAVTTYEMPCGATANLIVGPDRASVLFSAGQVEYRLSLDGDDAEAVIKEILDAFG